MGSVSAGGNTVDKFDKSAYEKTWANHAARLNLGDEDKALWNSSRYTIRPFVYFDKILVAWTVKNGEPQVKDIFTVTSIDASFQEGLWVRVQSKVNKGRDHMITPVPRRLPGLEIFAWVPYFHELRYTPSEWNDPNSPMNLRLALCFKSRSAPDPLAEGEHFLSELHTFRARFPQYRDTRF